MSQNVPESPVIKMCSKHNETLLCTLHAEVCILLISIAFEHCVLRCVNHRVEFRNKMIFIFPRMLMYVAVCRAFHVRDLVKFAVWTATLKFIYAEHSGCTCQDGVVIITPTTTITPLSRSWHHRVSVDQASPSLRPRYSHPTPVISA